MNRISYFSIVGLTFSRACSHSAKLKQVWLCTCLLAAFTALYVVTVFATAFFGYFHPFCWVGFPALAALFGAYSYYHVTIRWPKFGAGTLLGLVFGLFLLITGEGDVVTLGIMTAAGVASDFIRKLTDRLTYAYPVLAIGVISWLLPLWTRTQWYHDGAAEELGNDYADGLMLLANWWGLLLITAITAIMGCLGIHLVVKCIKSK